MSGWGSPCRNLACGSLFIYGSSVRECSLAYRKDIRRMVVSRVIQRIAAWDVIYLRLNEGRSKLDNLNLTLKALKRNRWRRPIYVLSDNFPLVDRLLSAHRVNRRIYNFDSLFDGFQLPRVNNTLLTRFIVDVIVATYAKVIIPEPSALNGPIEQLITCAAPVTHTAKDANNKDLVGRGGSEIPSQTAHPVPPQDVPPFWFLTEDGLARACDWHFNLRRPAYWAVGTPMRQVAAKILPIDRRNRCAECWWHEPNLLQRVVHANDSICVGGGNDSIYEFVTQVAPWLPPFKLVTIENDASVPPKWLHEKTLPNIVVWYGWNANGTYPSKVQPLPLGVNEGRHGASLARLIQSPFEVMRHHSVLVNFKLDRPWRLKLWNLSRRWSFARRVSYDAKAYREPASYYRLLRSFTHVACPQGLGMDTHRVWEALYLNVTPIVLRSPLSRLYAELPVVQLDRWEQLPRFWPLPPTDDQQWHRVREQLSLRFWTSKYARQGVAGDDE